MTKHAHLLSMAEIDRPKLDELLNLSQSVKKNPGDWAGKLAGRVLSMVFQKPSTRTRASFEAGIFQLGGHAINFSAGDMQISRGETIADTARTLSLYSDCIMARVYEHETVAELAENSSVPVINGLSNSFHPCQTLADLFTILEKKGRIDGLRIAWVGDGNNVCSSLMYGCGLADSEIAVSTPAGFMPDPGLFKACKGASFVDDPKAAVADADVVMTDTFASIHDDPARVGRFYPRFTVDEGLMGLAKPDAIFMHCLPAKRGVEVSASVIDGPQSVVWDEAENRLHTQKALLLSLLA